VIHRIAGFLVFSADAKCPRPTVWARFDFIRAERDGLIFFGYHKGTLRQRPNNALLRTFGSPRSFAFGIFVSQFCFHGFV
jgi:hypothetical protein